MSMPILEIKFEGSKGREKLKSTAIGLLEEDTNIKVRKVYSDRIRFETDISRAQRAMSDLIKSTGVAKSRLTLKTV